MGRDLQFKIHATLASDRMVFPGVVHHGMFCVYGHVVGVQRYEQPNTMLVLDTGAEVCVACIDSTHVAAVARDHQIM